MGPPGAGKGTQSAFVCTEYQIPGISTGEMLREAVAKKITLGLKAKEYMDQGTLVPDEVVIGLVKDRIQQEDALKGYLLDGFPRTVEQADALKKMLSELNEAPLDMALNLAVPPELLVERLLIRAQKEGRSDDTEEVIRTRIETYNQKTLPLLDYYRKEGILREVNGTGSLEEVQSKVKESL